MGFAQTPQINPAPLNFTCWKNFEVSGTGTDKHVHSCLEDWGPRLWSCRDLQMYCAAWLPSHHRAKQNDAKNCHYSAVAQVLPVWLSYKNVQIQSPGPQEFPVLIYGSNNKMLLKHLPASGVFFLTCIKIIEGEKNAFLHARWIKHRLLILRRTRSYRGKTKNTNKAFEGIGRKKAWHTGSSGFHSISRNFQRAFNSLPWK